MASYFDRPVARFVPDGAGQLLVYDDGGPAGAVVEGDAQRPRGAAGPPAGDDDVSIPEEAEGAAALL
jgi:hypothetical protein